MALEIATLVTSFVGLILCINNVAVYGQLNTNGLVVFFASTFGFVYAVVALAT